MHGPAAYSTSARYYDALNTLRDYDSHIRFLNQLFRSHSPFVVKRALDLGCGTGGHALRLAAKGYEICGIDVSKDMLREASAKLKRANVKLVNADLTDFSLNSTFDAAYALSGVVAFLDPSNIKSFFRRVRAHLRSRGLFVFDFYTPSIVSGRTAWWANVYRRGIIVRLDRFSYERRSRCLSSARYFLFIKGTRVVNQVQEDVHFRLYTMAEISKIVRRSGFAVVRLFEGNSSDYSKRRPNKSSSIILVVCKKLP